MYLHSWIYLLQVYSSDTYPCVHDQSRRKESEAICSFCSASPTRDCLIRKVWDLAHEDIHEMTLRKMKVACNLLMFVWCVVYSISGSVTNGEWNSLWMKGNTRPLSVLHIRSNVQAKYAHVKSRTMIGMSSPEGMCYIYNLMLLLWLCHNWSSLSRWESCCPSVEPCCQSRVDERDPTMAWGRCYNKWCDSMFETVYSSCWLHHPQVVARCKCNLNVDLLIHTALHHSLDKDETTPEKLRSILAQLDYQYQVNTWHARGVPFKDHLYVPEIHPETGMEFYEREDEGHACLQGVCPCHQPQHWLYTCIL